MRPIGFDYQKQSPYKECYADLNDEFGADPHKTGLVWTHSGARYLLKSGQTIKPVDRSSVYFSSATASSERPISPRNNPYQWCAEDMVRAMSQVMHRDVHLDANVSRVRASEFDISVIVKQWESIIRKYIGE